MINRIPENVMAESRLDMIDNNSHLKQLITSLRMQELAIKLESGGATVEIKPTDLHMPTNLRCNLLDTQLKPIKQR